MNYLTARRKHRAVNEAESAGLVADSIEVRKALVKRIESGEITPEQGWVELAKIKRNAKKAGLLTRSQAYNRG